MIKSIKHVITEGMNVVLATSADNREGLASAQINTSKNKLGSEIYLSIIPCLLRRKQELWQDDHSLEISYSSMFLGSPFYLSYSYNLHAPSLYLDLSIICSKINFLLDYVPFNTCRKYFLQECYCYI